MNKAIDEQRHSRRFTRACRLLKGVDFRRVFDWKCSAADDTIVVYACPNELGHSRLGLSVSRKVGNAVVRNQWKRRIREAFRQRREDLPVGFDFVVIPRKGAKPLWSSIDVGVAKVFRRSANKVTRKSDGNHGAD